MEPKARLKTNSVNTFHLEFHPSSPGGAASCRLRGHFPRAVHFHPGKMTLNPVPCVSTTTRQANRMCDFFQVNFQCVCVLLKKEEVNATSEEQKPRPGKAFLSDSCTFRAEKGQSPTVPRRTMLFFMLQHWAVSLHFSKGFMDPFIVNYKSCMKVSCCVFE